MVAAITHETPHHILYTLPYAQGLQYQSLWLEIHRSVHTIPTAPGDLDTAGSWNRIAGIE